MQFFLDIGWGIQIGLDHSQVDNVYRIIGIEIQLWIVALVANTTAIRGRGSVSVRLVYRTVLIDVKIPRDSQITRGILSGKGDRDVRRDPTRLEGPEGRTAINGNREHELSIVWCHSRGVS